MKPFSVLTVAIAILFLLSCNARSSKPVESAEKITSKPRVDVGSDTVYKSSDLVVLQLSKHTFQHISFLQTQDFGRVACNGLLITNDGQGLIFDTPADTTGSEELINFAQQNLGTHL